MDGPTDRRTDRAVYRDARWHLMIYQLYEKHDIHIEVTIQLIDDKHTRQIDIHAAHYHAGALPIR